MGGDKLSVNELMRVFERLESLGYKDGVHWSESASEDTMTILSENMAEDEYVEDLLLQNHFTKI